MGKLPKKQRQAMLMYYFEGLSYEEIAFVMDLERVHSARKLIYKAIDFIRDDLHKIEFHFILPIICMLSIYFL